MNTIIMIIICLFLIFLFIIYLIFSAQGINIFVEIFNFIKERVGFVFTEALYVSLVVGMLSIIIVALVLFKYSSGK